MPRLPHSTAAVAAIPALCLLLGSRPAQADPVARAGRDFLAYPSETIVLDGTASEAAEGAEWRWVQIGGPTVALREGATARPRFRISDPGRYTFELVIREGSLASAPDTVDVIAVDPEAADQDQSGCSVDPGTSTCPGTGAGWGLGLLLVGLAWRRRQPAPVERSA